MLVQCIYKSKKPDFFRPFVGRIPFPSCGDVQDWSTAALGTAGGSGALEIVVETVDKNLIAECFLYMFYGQYATLLPQQIDLTHASLGDLHEKTFVPPRKG